jgi:hypothetical protein
MIRRSALVLTGAAGLLALRPATGLAQQATGTVAPDQVSRMALGVMAFALATSQLAQQRAENVTVKTFSSRRRSSRPSPRRGSWPACRCPRRR